MSFKTVSALLRGAWLIDPEFAKAHIPLVQNLISGNFEGFKYKADKTSKVFAVNTFKARKTWSDFNDAPKGSIAVIPVNGPILKHDNCGDPGSMTRARQIKEADSHQNIDAIILEMDSPGGMVDGTQTFADAIEATTKPIIAVVNDGMSASACYWLAAKCDEIYVTRKTDMVGSIGVYLTFADFTKFYEEKGIKIYEIYAPESSEKNKDYKEALKGNYSLIEEQLSFLAQTFIEAVKSGRGDKINLSKGNPFKGKMYFAEEALSIGLIDGIKSFDEVIARASELSQQNNSNNNNSLNMSKKNYPAINAVLGVESLETTDEGVFLNEDQMKAIEAGLTPDKTLVTAENHQKTVEELTTAKTSSEETLVAISKNLGIEATEGEDFNAETVTAAITAKITELKGGSSEKPTATNEAGDSVEEGEDPMAEIKKRDYYKDAEEALHNS